MNAALIYLATTLGLCVSFFGVLLLARRMNNYGVVDIAWSYAFGAVAIVFAACGSGWLPRRIVIAGMVVLWSVRLGTHLLRRVMGHHPAEDTRYAEMRRRWSANFSTKMFWFFQMQALSVAVLAWPFFLVTQNTTVGFHALEIAGVSVWLIALGGEALADGQLARFKADAANKGRVCDVGLWLLSRHPNYFFEWLIWVGYFVFALAAPWGWTAIISPAAILYLLLRVTGIPLTEEQSVRSKGDAYRRYQATTSAFVPWFPKTPSISSAR